MSQRIATEKAPAAIGPYSQGMVCGTLLFTSGQIPVEPSTKAVPDDVAGRCPLPPFTSLPRRRLLKTSALFLKPRGSTKRWLWKAWPGNTACR